MERKPWKVEEDNELKELVREIGYSNWTLIAIRLTEKCPDTSRNGKQCRERWFYHLNDEISKKPWSEKEQKIIFQMHGRYGSHWKEITKHLEKRSENDVKNHFYAELRKGIRRINKFLGFKFVPGIIRAIRPSIISHLLEAQHKQEREMGNISGENGSQMFSLIVKFARNEPNQQESIALLEDSDLMKRIQNFINKIIEQNKNYLKKKEEAKKERARQKPVLEIKENQGEAKMEFDISEYLNLEYHASSPSSQNFKSEEMSLQSYSGSSESPAAKSMEDRSENIEQQI